MRSKSLMMIFIISILSLLLFAGTVLAARPAYRVFVQGTNQDVWGPFSGETTINVTAMLDEQGKAWGHARFNEREMDVTCVSIEGNYAWVSGIVTTWEDPDSQWIGQYAVFLVVDNDDGATPDQITNWGFWIQSPDVCTFQPELTFPGWKRDWINGDVRIIEM